MFQNTMTIPESYSIQQKKRRIGILDGLATFTEVGDGKITVEEFLGL